MVWACQEKGTGRSAEDGGRYEGSGKEASGNAVKNVRDSVARLLRWWKLGKSKMEEHHWKPNPKNGIKGLQMKGFGWAAYQFTVVLILSCLWCSL